MAIERIMSIIKPDAVATNRKVIDATIIQPKQIQVQFALTLQKLLMRMQFTGQIA